MEPWLERQWSKVKGKFFTLSLAGVLRSTAIIIFLVIGMYGWKTCNSINEPAKGERIATSDTVVVKEISKSLIDSTLTSKVDPAFVPRVSSLPVDRKDMFRNWLIIAVIAVGLYNVLKLKWNWGKTAMPTLPGGIYVGIFGGIILHWLLWALAPTWWESFYQSQVFWPINIGFGVFGGLAAVAGNAGGKKVNTTFKAVVGLAIVIFSMAAWPPPKKEIIVPYNLGTTDDGLASKVPDETARLIEETFSRYGDFVINRMKRIACAESVCGIQFEPDDSTKVRRGRENPNAVGIFQIMSTLHSENCMKEGHDIMTAKGNVNCAYLLFQESGTKPWNSSKGVWGDGVEITSNPTSRSVLSLNHIPGEASECQNHLVGNRDELIVVVAPADTWSEKVLTCRRRLHWDDGQRNVEVIMMDETDMGKVLRVGEKTIWPRYPEWVKVKSTADTAVVYTFVRSAR